MPQPISLRFAALVGLAVLAGFAIAAPIQAQPFHEEEQPAPPPAGCLGTNDPWCDAGGGSGDDPDPRCHVCAYIPQGPDGNPADWDCVIDSSCCDAELSNCRWGTSYCYYDGYCVYT